MMNGEIVHYEVQRESIEFASFKGHGLIWSSPFTFTGKAERGYTTPDGQYRISEVERKCEGAVDITFPDETLNLNTTNEITPMMKIDVVIDSLNMDDDEPSVRENLEGYEVDE